MNEKKSYTLDDAIKKLEHYCAYQERCHKEVIEKLQQMHMIPEAIDVVLVHLIENKFLNEARFAEAFASGKFKIKKWGRSRITFELKKKGVSAFNINKAIEGISDEEYYSVFNELAENKVKLIKETNVYKRKKKFVDYFLYRGWESYLVYDKANELIK